jgi:hypothetical protein
LSEFSNNLSILRCRDYVLDNRADADLKMVLLKVIPEVLPKVIIPNVLPNILPHFLTELNILYISRQKNGLTLATRQKRFNL